MNKNLPKIIDEAVDSLEGELVEFLQGMIKIPTENPPGKHYMECAKFIGNKMEEIGFKVDYVEVPKGMTKKLAPHGEESPRVSVIGVYGSEQKPVLHFSGHYDVVPAGSGWTVNPYSGEIKDGKIFGRGSSDQKSGIAAQIYAVAALKLTGIDLYGKILSSATPDEETGGFGGLGYLVDNGYLDSSNTDYCVITECLDFDKVCLGHRGTLWFELTTKGKQSHGSMPSEGVNAIDKMRSLINEIENNIFPLIKDKSSYPIQPEKCRESTLACTVIEAGNKVNTVPAECKACFDWRLIPEQNLDWAKETLIQVCEDWKSRNKDSDYNLNILHQVDPLVVPDDTPLVKVFLSSGQDVLNREMEFSISPGSDDQRFVVNQGGLEQCIVYGPGALAHAHKSDEYICISELKQAVKIMALSAVKLLNEKEKYNI